MKVTGTHFAYYWICHRKLWLFAHSIQMEHTSDVVYEGKLIHETTYLQRTGRYQEIEVNGIKIDYYDPNKKIVHEVKKSDKAETAHEWQVKYYIYKLGQNGIDGVTGILEYPKLRKTTEVFLSNRDKEEIKEIEENIKKIITGDDIPGKIGITFCRRCSYYDFCWIE